MSYRVSEEWTRVDQVICMDGGRFARAQKKAFKLQFSSAHTVEVYLKKKSIPSIAMCASFAGPGRHQDRFVFITLAI